MPRKTIKDLEEQLQKAIKLSENYSNDIKNLRNEIEDIKNDKGVISLVEYEQIKKQLKYEKSKNGLDQGRYERLKIKYDELKSDHKELLNKVPPKNARNAGRKVFDDKDTIKNIYELYLQGKSLKNIAEELNNNSTVIKNWSKSTINFILRNKKNVELGFITEETYNSILNLLNERRKNKKSSN